MPFAQISMTEGKSAGYRATLMEEIYLAMRDTITTTPVSDSDCSTEVESRLRSLRPV